MPSDSGFKMSLEHFQYIKEGKSEIAEDKEITA